jgi:serine/threonine-protein kinase
MDLGVLPQGSPYIVMELLSGMDLGRLLETRGRLPVKEAVGYVIHALSGIRSAHLIGVVHRDLKPSNLFLARTSDGRSVVKVLDFGISKAMGPAGQAGITGERNIIGSPAYMSPEQAKSSPAVDARADIWTVGVILYELLTGAVPFAAESIAEVLADILGKVPPLVTLRRPEVPPELAAVIARCLEKDPARRFPDAGALALALAPFGPWAQPDAQVTALPDRGRGWALQSMLDLEAAVPPAPQKPADAAQPPAAGVKTVDAWTQKERESGTPAANKAVVALGATLGAIAVAAGILLWARWGPPSPTVSGTAAVASADPTSAQPADPPREEPGAPPPAPTTEPGASASAEASAPAPTRKTAKPGALRPPHRSDIAKQRR